LERCVDIMRTPQELREVILELLRAQESNTHRMLKACGYNTSLVNDLKKGQMPSADKLANIANFLGVTSEFLLDSGADFGADFDLIARLRLEFYGHPETPLTAQDKLAVVDMARKIREIRRAGE